MSSGESQTAIDVDEAPIPSTQAGTAYTSPTQGGRHVEWKDSARHITT